MSKSVFLICAMVYITGIAFGQITKVKDQEAAKAESLKKKYDKDTYYVALQSNLTYTFQYSKRTKAPVAATEHLNETIMSLKDGVRYVEYISYDDQSSVGRVRGFDGPRRKPLTFFPNCGSVEVNGLFHTDQRRCTFSHYFDTRGMYINYEYDLNYYDVKYMTSVYFHEWLPVLKRKVKFIVPNWLEIELKEMNFEGYSIKKTVTTNDKKKQTTYIYEVRDLIGYKREKRAPKIAQKYPHLLILCKSYKAKGQERKNLFSTTADLYSWYHSLTKDLDNKPEEFKNQVNTLIGDAKTDIEKVEAIFYWVQEHIRYIAFEQGIMGFKPENANMVYKNKYGDCKGMANLTKEMLKLAGFDARLTWIGTRGIPYDYSIPSLSVDNHMICTLILSGKRYFLDATEIYISFNDYAHRIQGRPVLIEDGEDFIIDKVPEFDHNRNTIERKVNLKLDNETLVGHYEATYNGEERTGLLQGYSQLRSDRKTDAIRALLTGNDKNIAISNVNEPDFDERRKPLNFSYDFEWKNQITAVDNEVYFNFEMDKDYVGLKFDSTRINDYQFYSKKHVKSEVVLTIPSNYKIDYVPETVSFVNDNFSFDLRAIIKGNTIIYKKEIKIKDAVIRASEFDDWNNNIKRVKEFYNDQVILIKQ